MCTGLSLLILNAFHTTLSIRGWHGALEPKKRLPVTHNSEIDHCF